MSLLEALQRLASDPMLAAIEEWLDVVSWRPGVDIKLIEAFTSLANDSADEETVTRWSGDLEALEALYLKHLSLQPAGAETVGGDN